MAKFYPISEEEMQEFLEEFQFQPITVEAVKEKVFGKIVAPKVCLRVYTGIVKGESRTCGKDAIRCTLFTKDGLGKPVMLGGSKRVHRVEGWKANLAKRIKDMGNNIPEIKFCPDCGGVLRTRKNRQTGEEFLGCSNYPRCKKTV